MEFMMYNTFLRVQVMVVFWLIVVILCKMASWIHLCNGIKAWSVVIMDNASIHHINEVTEFKLKQGCVFYHHIPLI